MMTTNFAPKLPPLRCDTCDEIIQKEWVFCPYCGIAIARYRGSQISDEGKKAITEAK